MPEWSIRVSLTNLDDDAYPAIGKAIDKLWQEYANDWKSRGKSDKES